MTTNKLFQLIMAVADDVARVFDHAEIATWPRGSVDQLHQLGLLRMAATGMTCTCPHCADGHIEPVVPRRGSDGKERYFIYCPQSLRMEVTPEMYCGWEVNPDGLARAVSKTFALTGQPHPLVPDRLWRLGRVPWHDHTREVLLGRRLCDADATQVVCQVPQGGRAVVLVPFVVPNECIWPGRAPAVINLSRVADIGKTGLELEVRTMWEIVKDHDDIIAATSALPVDPAQKKLIVRRQLKAELKSHLSDEPLIAAYRQCGSYRAAAQMLADQMGVPISKDKIYRAVERHGGGDKVRADADSASVARTVASQSRDRGEKFIARR